MPSGRGSSSAGSAGCRRSSSSTCAPSSPAGTDRSSRATWPRRSQRCGGGAEQAVLLINRRGAATFILCRDCGESVRCPDCDLPFVYPSERRNAALPPLRADGRSRRALPELRQRPDPLLRRRDAAGRGGAARSLSRRCGSRGSTRTRSPPAAASRRSTTTFATAALTCWSGPSSPRRASTCPA